MKGLRELLGIESNADVLTPKLQMGIALARTQREGQTYAGTVPYAVTQRQRAANRRARAARRITRRSR